MSKFINSLFKSKEKEHFHFDKKHWWDKWYFDLAVVLLLVCGIDLFSFLGS